jgi:hypothetical protein
VNRIGALSLLFNFRCELAIPFIFALSLVHGSGIRSQSRELFSWSLLPGSTQTLHSESFILINQWMSFIDYLRFDLSAIEYLSSWINCCRASAQQKLYQFGYTDSFLKAKRNRGKFPVKGTCFQFFLILITKFLFIDVPNSNFLSGFHLSGNNRLFSVLSSGGLSWISIELCIYRMLGDLNLVVPICWSISIKSPSVQSIYSSVCELSSKNLFDSNTASQLNSSRYLLTISHPCQNILSTLVPTREDLSSSKLWLKIEPPDASSSLQKCHPRAAVGTFACTPPSSPQRPIDRKVGTRESSRQE